MKIKKDLSNSTSKAALLNTVHVSAKYVVKRSPEDNIHSFWNQKQDVSVSNTFY